MLKIGYIVIDCEEPATTWVVMADIEGNEFCVLKEK